MKQATSAFQYDRQLICPDALLQVLNGDWEAIEEILEVFLGDLPRMLAQLESITFARHEDLVFALHDLAGALGAAGAVRALDDTLRLVQIVRARKQAGWTTELRRLLQSVQQFAAAADKLAFQIREKAAAPSPARPTAATPSRAAVPA